MNPAFRCVSQKSLLKPHVATQSPCSNYHPEKPFTSPAASFLIPQNKIKVPLKQQVQQKPFTMRGFSLISCFCFLPKSKKRQKQNHRAAACYWCTWWVHKWPEKVKSCLISFQCFPPLKSRSDRVCQREEISKYSGIIGTYWRHFWCHVYLLDTQRGLSLWALLELKLHQPCRTENKDLLFGLIHFETLTH